MSSSEIDYKETFDRVRKLCPLQAQQDYLINEVDAKKEHFSHYLTRSYRGHMYRLGDQLAESNHFSYCARISFGCFIEPAKQVVACIE